MSVHRPIVAGAALLGAMLLATPAAGADDPVVAIVNGRPLHMSEVLRQVESLPLGDQLTIRQQLPRFAESVVREEILFQFVLAADFESDPELREQIRSTVVERLIRRHVDDRIQITDRQIAEYYRDNASAIRGENLRASQILLATRGECDVLIATPMTDADFADTARTRSLDRESAARGGDIGLFMNHSGPYGFETELFRMQPGETRAFDTDRGCHLVRVTERETPPLPPLAEVEDRLRAILEARLRRELLERLLARASETVSVERPGESP
jgi:parvulin-like peptidyl-prolyl isomerase